MHFTPVQTQKIVFGWKMSKIQPFTFFFTIFSLSNWHYSSIVYWLACSYQGKAYRHKSPCCSFSFLSPVLCRWSYFHRIVPYCIPLFCFASKEIYSAMVNILSLHTIQSVYSNILKNMDKKWFWIHQTMNQSNIFCSEELFKLSSS